MRSRRRASAMCRRGHRTGKTCPSCMGQWVATPSDRRTYCSPACADVAKLRPPHMCGYCKTRFRPSYKPTRAEGRFCSRSCAQLSRTWGTPVRRSVMQSVAASQAVRAKRASAKPCTVCSRVTMRARCGRACELENHRVISRRHSEGKHNRPSFDCIVCGRTHFPDYGDKRRTLCSDLCADVELRRSRRRHKVPGMNNHRQRARRYGVAYQPIRPRDVFERDGWKCGICGGAIKRSARFPRPLSPSLDHIVPMSKGGGHVYTNVQASHFRCNASKGDKAIGSQLLLLGEVEKPQAHTGGHQIAGPTHPRNRGAAKISPGQNSAPGLRARARSI